MLPGSIDWLNVQLQGLMAGVILLSLPAFVNRINKARKDRKVAKARLDTEQQDRLNALEKDMNLILDWLLGPMGFDGHRHGGFMRADKEFKQDIWKVMRGRRETDRDDGS